MKKTVMLGALAGLMCATVSGKYVPKKGDLVSLPATVKQRLSRYDTTPSDKPTLQGWKTSNQIADADYDRIKDELCFEVTGISLPSKGSIVTLKASIDEMRREFAKKNRDERGTTTMESDKLSERLGEHHTMIHFPAWLRTMQLQIPKTEAKALRLQKRDQTILVRNGSKRENEKRSPQKAANAIFGALLAAAEVKARGRAFAVKVSDTFALGPRGPKPGEGHFFFKAKDAQGQELSLPKTREAFKTRAIAAVKGHFGRAYEFSAFGKDAKDLIIDAFEVRPVGPNSRPDAEWETIRHERRYMD